VFRHRTLTVGGTFWPLHRGHRQLLDAAFSDGLEVFIGLTSDGMTRSKDPSGSIPSYGTRKRDLLRYLREKGFAERAHVFRIEDEYGFAADFSNLQAIAVTEESLPNAKKINVRRTSRGMEPLDIVMVDLVSAEDGRPISSQRIRSGEIDGEGRLKES
jgi:phosphopantetheine adenylyltransferase